MCWVAILNIKLNNKLLVKLSGQSRCQTCRKLAKFDGNRIRRDNGIMNSEQLYGMALGLHTPWQLVSIEFKPGTKGGEELHLTIGFARGSRFADGSGQACPVHDTVSAPGST